ncbi:MAG: TIGR03936 family radical SAM-associated protein [Chloroflexota bacterium]
MRHPEEARAQRLRVRFARGKELAFISHLDLMRFWERALRRAGLPLAYSQGFTPHPRLSLAAPLALGVTSEAELMDVYLTRWVSPHNFLHSLRQQLPPGIQLLEANTIPPTVPSLQSQVRFAEYHVVAERKGSPEDVPAALSKLLAARTFMWQHARDTGVRSYDLRALVSDLWLVNCEDNEAVLGMRLRCDPGGAGRPEQVLSALGFPGLPRSIHRTRLILEAPRGQKR